MGRIHELERDLEESEIRRKQLSSATREGAGGYGASLRASEDRYLREEVLRDELNNARRARLDLESSVLEKDSKLMEYRFELEAKETEISRLKRRLTELEAVTRSMGGAGAGAGPGRAESPHVRAAGSRFNKDRDTEVVVESLRKVVDKLKAENERLKRGVGTGEGRTNDVEKRLATERKRTEKLEEDVCLVPLTSLSPPLLTSHSLSLSLPLSLSVSLSLSLSVSLSLCLSLSYIFHRIKSCLIG
jgi:hypothetical protein